MAERDVIVSSLVMEDCRMVSRWALLGAHVGRNCMCKGLHTPSILSTFVG